jgi:hypothetical protein
MSLQVAACPNCGGAVVFGEPRCRTCGQVFDYGASPPPPPTNEQLVAALRAVGITVAAPAAVSSPAASDGSVLGRFEDGALETGRHDDVAVDIEAGGVAGLIDSTLFAAMTPDHVYTDVVPGLEHTALVDVDVAVDVAPASVGFHADAGRRGADATTVAVDAVPGIYHSDMFHTDVEVGAGAALAGDLLEVSPSVPRKARRSASSTRTEPLPRIACPACGTVHAASRCPNCATSHPDTPSF